MQKEFKALIQPKTCQKNQDDIFDSLKSAVLGELLKRHKWEEKVSIFFYNYLLVSPYQLFLPNLLRIQATEILRVLQLNALADQAITDKQQWDGAVKFLESSMKHKYNVWYFFLRSFYFVSELLILN